MIPDLILAPCSAGCDDGWVTRYVNNAPQETKCPRCKGTGKEPPLSERELEERGQTTLLVEPR